MEGGVKFKETGFFQRNLNLKLLSLFLALVLWLYVHSTGIFSGATPMETDVKVPISYDGVPANMTVTEGPSHVVVTVRGTREQVESLLPSQIKVAVNQLTTRPGVYNNLMVHVDKPNGITVLKVSPDKVSFLIQNKNT